MGAAVVRARLAGNCTVCMAAVLHVAYVFLVRSVAITH